MVIGETFPDGGKCLKNSPEYGGGSVRGAVEAADIYAEGFSWAD
jgi:hypothetical protein